MKFSCWWDDNNSENKYEFIFSHGMDEALLCQALEGSPLHQIIYITKKIITFL